MSKNVGIAVCIFLIYGWAQSAELNVAPDTLEARAQGCATCHGPHGEGVKDLNFPRIAGKPAGYLWNQLRNFRDGQRSYPPMNYLVAYLHDDYLRELAGYFAAQGIKQTAPLEPDSAAPAAGEHLARQGDVANGVPACVLCHGKLLTGIEADRNFKRPSGPRLPTTFVARNQPYVASKLRGRVPCLGYSGRRCASAQGPRPLTDRRPQRAAPPATHPLCRSLELRTSGPRPPPSPAHGIATHPPVHSRLGCSGGPRAPSGSSL
jgi:cytochrome c553